MTDEEIRRYIIRKRKKAKRRRRALILLVLLLIAGALLIKIVIRSVTDAPAVRSVEDVYEANITDVRDAVVDGRISCHELTQYYLDRIEQYNGTYNCFITMCDDALAKADEIDAEIADGREDGLLLGIPVVIKDNMDLAGYETTNGFAKGSYGTEDSDAYVVDRLLDEGAVIIGKTNMSTEAQSATCSYSQAIGSTHNAYNPKYSPGGSSGGTAAAVSLDFCMAGLGSDTNSSLRIPAAFNGDVALRSTFGLIDRSGIVELNRTRDVAGAITRNVPDTALMLDVLTEGTYDYYGNLDAEAMRGARIGVIQEFDSKEPANNEGLSVNEEAYAAWENAKDEMELNGAELVEVSLPVVEYKNKCYMNSATAEKAEYLDIFRQVMAENDLDAMVYPDSLSDSIPVENASEAGMISGTHYISPIIGIPDITVQIGQMSTGVGVGMSIIADRNEEQKVLNLAYSYVCKFDHRVAPALDEEK